MLAIDTTTEACSVALLNHEECVEKFQIAPRLHGEIILKMVDEILCENGIQLSQIDAFAVNCGLGAFTGVRLGISVIQALAFSQNKKVYSVNTLQIMALQCLTEIKNKRVDIEKTTLMVAMDARLQELYWQCFRLKKGQLIPMNEAQVGAIHQLELPDSKEGMSYFSCGNGWEIYAQEIEARLARKCHFMLNQLLPHAKSALRWVQQNQTEPMEPQLIEPLYIRDKVAKTTAERTMGS